MEAIQQEVETFWQAFIQQYHLEEGTRYFSAYHFCLDEKNANELLALVLSGQKKATASSYVSFAKLNQTIPQVNDYNVLIDYAGHPHCVIQNTKVTILPFRAMTFELCRREGEDDNLASWQENHRRFFTQEGAELGYKFDEDMLVVFEEFRVVYKK